MVTTCTDNLATPPTTSRRTLPKRARYEILRRDNHTCRYCGGRAPDVALTVDHIRPVALGGTDDPSNLAAACRDCNAGKSSTSGHDSIVADVDADALRWAAAIRRAAEDLLAARAEGETYLLAVCQQWERYAFDCYLPADAVATVDRWRSLGLPVEVITDAVIIAFGRSSVRRADKWRYVCGIVWRKLTELQDAAAAALAEEAPPPPPPAPEDPSTWAPYSDPGNPAWMVGMYQGTEWTRDMWCDSWSRNHLAALSAVVDGHDVAEWVF